MGGRPGSQSQLENVDDTEKRRRETTKEFVRSVQKSNPGNVPNKGDGSYMKGVQLYRLREVRNSETSLQWKSHSERNCIYSQLQNIPFVFDEIYKVSCRLNPLNKCVHYRKDPLICSFEYSVESMILVVVDDSGDSRLCGVPFDHNGLEISTPSVTLSFGVVPDNSSSTLVPSSATDCP